MKPPRIHRPSIVESIIEPQAERILFDLLESLKLCDVEVWIGRGAGENDRGVRLEARAQRRDGGDRSRPCRVARHRLDEVDAGIQPVAFVTAEEERFVFQERTANRSAKLVLLEC